MSADQSRDVAAPREFDVLTLGEAMVLFAAQEPGPLEAAVRFHRFCAGAELNVAIGLTRLGHRVGYLSRLGNDSAGRFLLRTLAQEGLDAGLVEIDDSHPSGFMLKSKAVDGQDPQIEYHRKGSAASAMSTTDLGRLDGIRARHLHLTGITPALSPNCRELVFATLAWARDRGMTISFDPNLRRQLWASTDDMQQTLLAIAAKSDIVLPGHAEGTALTGLESPQDIAEHFLSHGAKQVVVKLGSEGAWCASSDGMAAQVPGLRVDQVIDTVGAGDGFAVGVISGLREGLDLAAATARGNAIGARVVQFPGDSDGLPRRHEL